ncbi:MAG: hypothetical protein RL607_1331 [Bacteroidota bacterium]|jgi:uncharacterized membrane protein
MESQRPQLTIPLTRYDFGIEFVALAGLVASWIYVAWQYPHLPEVIPTHFNGQGQVDGYGDKWTIFMGIGFATAAYVVLTYIGRHPHWFNYPVAVTEANAPRLYQLSTRMLRTLKLVLVGVFFAIEWQTVQVAQHAAFDGGRWILLGVMGAVFVPLFYFLIQLFKNS